MWRGDSAQMLPGNHNDVEAHQILITCLMHFVKATTSEQCLTISQIGSGKNLQSQHLLCMAAG